MYTHTQVHPHYVKTYTSPQYTYHFTCPILRVPCSTWHPPGPLAVACRPLDILWLHVHKGMLAPPWVPIPPVCLCCMYMCIMYILCIYKYVDVCVYSQSCLHATQASTLGTQTPPPKPTYQWVMHRGYHQTRIPLSLVIGWHIIKLRQPMALLGRIQ